MGSSCWQLLALEHGIDPDGLSKHAAANPAVDTLFSESSASKFVPRSIFIDLEPTVIDVIRTGKYRHLFHPDCLLNGKEDAASNYARGFYTIGSEIIDLTLSRIRHIVENCDLVANFIVFHSFAGGTGSGFTALLTECMAAEYVKKSTFQFSVYPSPRVSTAVVEPYNSILMTHATLDLSNCSLLMDNEALFNLYEKNMGISWPTYSNINHIIAQVLCALTCPIRFPGNQGMNLNDLQTNLVPYPRIHFPVVSYAPVITPEKAYHEDLSTGKITAAAFQRNNQLVNVDLRAGRYMSCCLFYRGDVSPTEINRTLSAIKKKRSMDFVEWCPTGFKSSLSAQPPAVLPGGDLAKLQRAVCVAANTTAIRTAWMKLNANFDLLFSKRAFLHWYLNEGLDFDEFADARENLAALEEDYQEVHNDIKEDVEETIYL
ncbi:Tubulin is the major constituent of microtubules [Sparganum proliferum]